MGNKDIVDTQCNFHTRTTLPFKRTMLFHHIVSGLNDLSLDAYQKYLGNNGICKSVVIHAVGFFAGFMKGKLEPSEGKCNNKWINKEIADIQDKCLDTTPQILAMTAHCFFGDNDYMSRYLQHLTAFPKVKSLRWLFVHSQKSNPRSEEQLMPALHAAMKQGCFIDVRLAGLNLDVYLEQTKDTDSSQLIIYTLDDETLSTWHRGKENVYKIAQTNAHVKLLPKFQPFMRNIFYNCRTNLYSRLGKNPPNRSLWRRQDFIDYHKFMIHTIGPNRILFSTDWPLSVSFIELPELLELTNEAMQGLSSAEQQLIWSENAYNLYK